jgi:hypothetical protein
MKKDPMQNMGRAERTSRTTYDKEAMEVVATLKSSMSDKAAGWAEATKNDADNTTAALKENRAGFVDRIAQNPHGALSRLEPLPSVGGAPKAAAAEGSPEPTA